MRYKVKMLVGLAQCIAATPGVYDVTVPRGMEEYTRWLDLMELPSQIGLDIVIPGACFGSYHRCER